MDKLDECSKAGSFLSLKDKEKGEESSFLDFVAYSQIIEVSNTWFRALLALLYCV